MRIRRRVWGPRPVGKTPFPSFYYLAYMAGGLALCVWPFFAYRHNLTGRDGNSVRDDPFVLLIAFALGATVVVGSALSWWRAGRRAGVERRQSSKNRDQPHPVP